MRWGIRRIIVSRSRRGTTDASAPRWRPRWSRLVALADSCHQQDRVPHSRAIMLVWFGEEITMGDRREPTPKWAKHCEDLGRRSKILCEWGSAWACQIWVYDLILKLQTAGAGGWSHFHAEKERRHGKGKSKQRARNLNGIGSPEKVTMASREERSTRSVDKVRTKAGEQGGINWF